MRKRELILIAALCAAAVTPLWGQQAADSARTIPASSPRSAPASTLPGPRVISPFQRVQPRLAPTTTTRQHSSFMDASGDHTIVISTLALVLATIIVVLLVVR